jgi:glycyl-tRNA synthetase beta subunit
VNAPDPALRANRLALLKGIRSVFERFADLSRIQAAP